MIREPYIDHLVADSAAFLRNVPLQHMARHVLTVPEVVAEIRDKATRDRLQVLPYELKLKDPSDECIRQVSDFARKTGELRFLSATDVRVLALTLQVTRETVGGGHIRLQPAASRTDTSFYHPRQHRLGQLPVGFVDSVGAMSVAEADGGEEAQKAGGEPAEAEVEGGEGPRKADEALAEEETRVDGSGEAGKDGSKKSQEAGEPAEVKTRRDGGVDKTETGDSGTEKTGESEETKETVETPAGKDDGLVTEETERDGPSETDDPASEEMFDAREVTAEDDTSGEEGEEGDGEEAEEEQDEEEGEDDGWITPGNIQAAKSEMNSQGGEVEEPVKVACMTTDFTMQNVLKQMNLEMVSVEGRRIRQVRRFVLRCFGCFQVTPRMDKTFCPWCGNKTLKRVSITLRPDGTQEIHISTRKPISKRGTKFSLPLPRGGKYTMPPVLCEDQPLPQQRATARSKDRNAILSEDYVAGGSPFSLNDVNSRAAQLGRNSRQHHVPNWERRNPNARAPPTGNKKKRRK